MGSPPPHPSLRTSTALALEERVQRTPYSLPAWLAYLAHVPPSPALYVLHERAVAALPGSYKLWRRYAHFAHAYSLRFPPTHPARRAARTIALRAARALRRAPRLWADAVSLLARAACWTAARRALNDALRALPVLQHDAVWEAILPCVRASRDVPAVRAPPRLAALLLRRRAKLRPGEALEDLYRLQLAAGEGAAAVRTLCDALADPEWMPEGERTREELWVELARVSAGLKEEVDVDVPALLRGAVRVARTEGGELWVGLGEYFIRKELFEEARNVYEEAVGGVSSVRDFALVFDAYAKFEEGLVTGAMEDVEEAREGGRDGGEEDLKEAEEMVELHIARLAYLTERRPMLLSDVWLRQNPHNVHEWHKRARMFKAAKDAVNVVDTYTKAVQTVDPWRATNGRSHTLWLAFAGYYEAAGDLGSARRVLERAVGDPEAFRSADDLAAVWCEFAEMELRRVGPEAARAVLRRGTSEPEKSAKVKALRKKGDSSSNATAVLGAGAGNTIIKHEYDNASPAWQWYKSQRVWHFLIDLCQSTTTPQEVTKVHHRMFDLRIATAQTVLSGGAYLESKRLFEQAFRLYDRAASVISWPEALQIWVVYLTKFTERFGAKKLQRARDLFEEAIRSAPTTKKGGRVYPHEHLRLLYIMYASMEEEYSLARHAMKVLDRAVKAVREEDRPDMYRLYIVKIATMFGVTKTRAIYEEALSSLTRAEDVLEFAARYAAMETRVGEVDRARAIYAHTCEVADPRRRGIYAMFWNSWNEFELNHGSEDTFRDMLRQKRSVQLNHKGVITDEDGLRDTGGAGETLGIRQMVKDTDASKEMADRAGGTRVVAVSAETANGGLESNGGMRGGETENGIGNGNGNKNAEEIDIDVSDEDSDKGAAADHDDEAAAKASEGSEADPALREKSPGKENIVQKELPEALRKLVDVAHSTPLKRTRDREPASDNAETIERATKSSANGNGSDNGGEQVIGALERFKRRR